MLKAARCLFLVISVSLCPVPASPAASTGTVKTPALPASALPVPIVRQPTGYACGAAALLAVLFYWQVYDGRVDELLEVTGTQSEDGAPPQGIVAGAVKYGLKAHFKENVSIEDLKKALVRGETVVLDYQAWPDNSDDGVSWKKRREDGHYSVLIALDDSYAYFMDPSVGDSYTYIPIAELMDRWHDYEERNGKLWENERLAVFISGKTPLKKFPSDLIPTK